MRARNSQPYVKWMYYTWMNIAIISGVFKGSVRSVPPPFHQGGIIRLYGLGGFHDHLNVVDVARGQMNGMTHVE
jgi:hypothetical protein